MVTNKKISLFISLFIFFLSFNSISVEAEISKVKSNLSTINHQKLPKKLRVGIAGEPPGVIKSELGRLSGVGVEYWKELAQLLALDNYELIHYSSSEDSLAALADGQIDAALGMGITAKRIALFDFTQPIGQSKLTLLLPSSPPTLWSIIEPFLSRVFFFSVGGILLCLIIVGNLLWLAERHHNDQQFPKSYFQGVLEGIWCALVTLTTVGYGDRYPVTFLGRFVAGVWMILSLVVATSLTAGIATTLAVAFSSQPSQQFNRPSDLQGARIATLSKNSASTSWAKFYRARVSEAETLAEAIVMLERGRVDGIVYIESVLEYYLHQHPNAPYRLANFDLAPVNYGIALPLNSSLTRKLNEQILQIKLQLRLKEIRDNWREIYDENQEEKGL